MARNSEDLDKQISLGPIVKGILAIVAIVCFIVFGFEMIEINEAGHDTILQSVSGEMSVITSPGPFFQKFGTPHTYNQSDSYEFTQGAEERDTAGKTVSVRTDGSSIHVRFNDGGRAHINGSVRFALPTDAIRLTKLHLQFRSYDGFVRSALQPLVTEAVVLSAALMSAEQSYTTHRAQFSEYAQDQALLGIYLTEQREVTIDDNDSLSLGASHTQTDDSGSHKTKHIQVEIKRDKNGNPIRRKSPLDEYGVTITQFILKDIDYDEAVNQRIHKKQEALQATVQARAEAERAQQQKLTAEAEGGKNVAVAKYAALTEKETAVVKAEQAKEVAVTEARQKLTVAELAAQEASKYKEATLLRAEADAEAARKKFNADGALDKKLNAWLSAQQAYATAIGAVKGNIVPSVVFSGNGGGGGAGFSVSDMFSLMAARSAKELALDFSPTPTK